jgi:hypothetical protein
MGNDVRVRRVTSAIIILTVSLCTMNGTPPGPTCRADQFQTTVLLSFLLGSNTGYKGIYQ